MAKNQLIVRNNRKTFKIAVSFRNLAWTSRSPASSVTSYVKDATLQPRLISNQKKKEGKKSSFRQKNSCIGSLRCEQVENIPQHAAVGLI